MLDHRLRAVLDPALDTAGQALAKRGIGADQVTLIGTAFGLAAACFIAFEAYWTGLLLIAMNRIADGLDGAVARATRKTDRGGYLDITLDFVFYAAIPLCFAIADTPKNALAAACLLAAFLANGVAFMAFALMAERRGLATDAQGPKAFYYMTGIAEGTETIAVFVAMCLWPAYFPWLAIAFALMCFLSAIARIVRAWQVLGER